MIMETSTLSILIQIMLKNIMKKPRNNNFQEHITILET